MTPLRWNWSANTRGSLKSGRVSDLASPPSAAHDLRGRVSGSDGHFARALVAGCAEACGEAFRPMLAVPHALLLGRWVVLTDTLVEHRSLPHSPPWAGRDGEGRSGSKGGEGPARGDKSV